MRTLVRGLPFVLAVALILAGCLQSPGSGKSDSERRLRGAAGAAEKIPIDPGWAERALADEPTHDHKDPKQHANLSTPNFHVLGYDPLVTDYYGKTAGDHFCGETAEKDGRRISVTHSFGSDIAFVIADVTDAQHPKKIGEFLMQNTQVYDIDITPDLKNVLLSTSPLDAGPDVTQITNATAPPASERFGAGGSVLFHDACTGRTTPVQGPEGGLPYESGIVLVDIANPRDPSVIDFRPFPVLGGHSVHVRDMSGRLIVLVSVPNVPDQASYYVILELQETPVGRKMVPLSIYQFPEPSGVGPVTTTEGMHDGTIQKHPIDGHWYAYLAYGGAGLVIINIDDPSNPKFVSHWAEWRSVGKYAPTAPYIHEALPTPTAWDGHTYVFIGEECVAHPKETPTCLIFNLDTTNPAKPEFVGAWTLPIDVQWSRGLEYSLHYLGLTNRTLFATVYHGGVWAIDVSTPEALRTMPSIGAFLPSLESPKKFSKTPRSLLVQQLYGGYALDDTPCVLETNHLSDGTIVVFDGQSGLYTVHFDADNPAPPPPPFQFT